VALSAGALDRWCSTARPLGFFLLVDMLAAAGRRGWALWALPLCESACAAVGVILWVPDSLSASLLTGGIILEKVLEQ
jgi:hypothetical protein